jgi:hypothetical protein
MLRVVATVDENAVLKHVISLPASIVAAPKVTVAHAGPEVAPFPQYVKLVGVPAV